jgi:uncharacterized repeat protein (TIGR01451 family)
MVAGVLVSPATAAYPRPWPDNWDPNFTTPALNLNVRGNAVSVGNTILVCPSGLAGCTSDLSNNGQRMRYADVDGPGSQPVAGGGTVDTFDSSQATLNFPVGRGSILRAVLYWGADLAAGVNRGDPGNDPAPSPDKARQVLLSVDGAAYVPVAATKWAGVSSWYSTRPPGNEADWPTTCVDSVSACGFAYQARADVTSILTSSLARKRARLARQRRLTRAAATTLSIRVANLQSGTGNNRAGGWVLALVYDDPSQPFRNVTVFDGFRFAQVEGGELKVVGPLNLSGFRTKASGNPDAHVGIWAYEGDRGIDGDFATLGRAGITCPTLQNGNVVFDPNDQKYLTDALNPATNFFNSTISRLGQNVTAKNPNVDNQLGFDLDYLNDNTGFISNGVTGATVCLGTRGDTYFLGGLTFDALIDAPNTRIVKTEAPGDTKPVFKGDVVQYTVTVSNPAESGSENPDTLNNVVVTDPLDPGLDFVAFTDNPGGRCDLSGRTITCSGISLPKNGSFSFTFKARVTAPGGGSVQNRATYTGTYGDNNYPATGTSALITNPVYAVGVSKTAAPAFTRTYLWSVTKSGTGSPDLGALPPGQTGAASYNVTVTNTSHADSDFALSGSITVTNPAPIPARILTVTDDLPAGLGPAAVSCPQGLPATIPAQGTLTCTYSEELSGPTSGTNTARAGLSNTDWATGGEAGSTQSSGTASVAFGVPTAEQNKTVQVVDLENGTPVLLGTLTAGTPDLDANGQHTYSFTRPVGPLAQCQSTSVADQAQVLNAGGTTVITPPSDEIVIGAEAQCPAEVGITKRTQQSPVAVGAPVEFDVHVSSLGPGVARAVTVTDPVPGLVSVTSVTTNRGACTQGQSFTCTLGDMAPGESAEIAIRGSAGLVDAPTTVPNTASVGWTTDQGLDGTGQSTDRVTILPQWDMQVVKRAAPPSVAVGADLTYTLDVTNAGPSAVANGTLSDDVPPSLQVKSATVSRGTGSCTANGNAVSCQFGPMPAGDTRQVTVVGTATAGAAPSVTNTATVGPIACAAPAETLNCDTDPGNNTSTVVTPVTPVADVRIAKTGDATVAAGGDVNYELAASNQGPSDATDVVVTDTLPDGVNNPRATSSQGSCSVSGLVVTCRLGTLGVGKTAIIDVTVTTTRGQAGATLHDTAKVSATPPDPNPANNSDEATTNVARATAISKRLTTARTVVLLTKLADRHRVRPGGTVLFTVIWRNTGPSTVRRVRICDALPPHMSFASAPGAVLGDGLACWRRASVRSGGQLQFKVIARADAGVPAGRLLNRAVATAANAPRKLARALVVVFPSRARPPAVKVTG